MELPKLRLWARMIANGVHESTEEPPNVPMITGTISKCTKQESVHEVAVDAAKAVAQVFTGSTPQCSPTHTTQSTVATSHSTSLTASPARLADIRMKHYEQLRCLRKLFDDSILDEGKFLEQKRKILDVLKSL